MFYDGKVRTKFRQPPDATKLDERSNWVKIYEYSVLVTTSLRETLKFLANANVQHYFVDNEADCGYINAMIIKGATSREVLLFHGPSVYLDQWEVYKKLESINATCYAWSLSFESYYPNVVDLQDDFANRSG